MKHKQVSDFITNSVLERSYQLKYLSVEAGIFKLATAPLPVFLSTFLVRDSDRKNLKQVELAATVSL